MADQLGRRQVFAIAQQKSALPVCGGVNHGLDRVGQIAQKEEAAAVPGYPVKRQRQRGVTDTQQGGKIRPDSWTIY